MIISCIKTVNSFLDFFLNNNSKEEVKTPPSLDPPAATRHLHNMLSPAHGLGLISFSVTDSNSSPNILESAAVRQHKTVSESPLFGSSEEIRKVNDIEQLMNHGSFFSGPNNSTMGRKKFTCGNKRKEIYKVFPPPISSLNDDGKPNFILQPTRKDGRLEISEVRIYHPEILIEEEDEESDETGEEEDDGKFPAREGGGGEGFRQCHDLGMWRNNHFHFVTIT